METLESSRGIVESKEFVFNCIKTILDHNEEFPEIEWTQPAELNKIVDHWHNFDEETKNLILVAIPQVAPYLLKKKLEKMSTEI